MFPTNALIYIVAAGRLRWMVKFF